MNSYPVGSLVKFRGREWIIMPSADKDVVMLRALIGSENEITGIYLSLEGQYLEPALFPIPAETDIGDFESARLLRNAARLLLRNGTGPFRSFGQLAFRPRPYQLVPLLMALRLNTVRMLIADDVGVGKTLESALIARELLDRGEIQRIAVICPPYLCDQWQRELKEKLNLDAVIIRTSTLAKLEREIPRQDISVFKYYQCFITSVDFVKSEKWKYTFLEHCPDLIIVDEAHGCAKPAGQSVSQQQRHQLIAELAADSSKHLILVTATPHSGIEESFLSILGLVKENFINVKLDNLTSEERVELSRHFIQRTRGDVKLWMGTETPFPKRDPKEVSYTLSREYANYFNDVYEFTRGLVASVQSETGYRRRVRYWAALALLRCVMSSPASAETAFRKRIENVPESEDEKEVDYSPHVYDKTDIDSVPDEVPTRVVERGEKTFSDSEKRKLRDFLKRSENLRGENDQKIKIAEREIRTLLKQGFKPIVYCRYIATSDYVAEDLLKRLKGDFKDLHVISVTGALSEEEREIRIGELCKSKCRILVATDCMSEGINLQEHFNAVLHYDLPWNPNRLEQREGRIDRFNQNSEVVKVVLMYGSDNPIDGAVLNVLLRKARKIHKDTGIIVPIPVDSETVMEAVLNALFLKKEPSPQLRLFDVTQDPFVDTMHKNWERSAEEEKKSRSLFAQHSIKPDEVAKELEHTDSVLGSPDVVAQFIQASFQRLGGTIEKKNGTWKADFSNLPGLIKNRITFLKSDKLVFDTPVPEDAAYISRNHTLTNVLAEYLFESAFNPKGNRQESSRCGVIRSKDVNSITVLFLLRFRYLVRKTSNGHESIEEECIVSGYRGASPSQREWISKEEAESLFEYIMPSANLSDKDKVYWISNVLKDFKDIQSKFEGIARERKNIIFESNERLRKVTKDAKFSVEALPPPDVLAVLAVIPKPE